MIGRMFLYMPMMHSENIDVQNEMLGKFQGLVSIVREQSPKNVEFFEMSHRCAIEHRNIVSEFGRFPHRNLILGRTSTNEEIEFLKQDGSAF